MGELERGRAAVAGRSWREAHDALAAADAAAALAAADLELLATAAYMLGCDDEYLAVLERAHHAHLAAADALLAARCGFWMGMHLSLRGELGRGTGWLGRAKRLVDGHGEDCVERGLMLVPQAFRAEAEGDRPRAAELAGRAAAVAERFGDRDLLALALHVQGHFLVDDGHIAEGLALLDEAMVAVTSGEVAPIPSGIVYCGAIIGCKHAYDPRRAQEWTEALTRWCEGQHDLVAFSGRCLAHRAEILFLKGAWAEAVQEARRAVDRAARANNPGAVGEAWCLVGDVERLRGHPDAATAAYAEARRAGCEPQPGLALLRLAQGDPEAAGAAIRRALGETDEVPERTRLLPACAEIMLACGDVDAAGAACDELERVAAGHGSAVLGALVAQARAAVDLAGGDPAAALPPLRRAWRVWEEVGAPYEAARVRLLTGRAYRALGDGDAAELELREARAALERLGARVDQAGVDGGCHGLTARELEVLRLVATGATTKAIAAELVLSERTVDRHLSNIFAKLGVGTRTAAAAYAFEHGLAGG
jgi:ATP/maltotriose-dependent transcriptional regulator MalT